MEYLPHADTWIKNQKIKEANASRTRAQGHHDMRHKRHGTHKRHRRYTHRRKH